MIEPERLDYPLRAESLVWDIGAFLGEFSRAIAARYGCRVMAFEPIAQFARQIDEEKENPRIWIFRCGLADKDGEMGMALAGDRTTVYSQEAAMHIEYHAGEPEKVRFRDVVAFMDELGIGEVDLAKINIEGGEYPLLRRLIDSCYISRFRFLQVQFHTFMPNYGELYMALKKDLLRTHELSWRWPWRWESWARRS